MGMYTGLKGRILLNDSDAAHGLRFYLTEKRDDGMTYDLLWEQHRGALDYVKTNFPKEVQKYCDGRASWLMCNRDNSYMSDEMFSGGFLYPDNQFLSEDERVVYISTALKNYAGEIEGFCEHILPLIADAWDLLSIYEEVESIEDAEYYRHNIEMLEGY